MDETNSKLDQCIAVMQDNSEKSQRLISELEKERAESNSKDHTIKSQSRTIRIQAIILGICFLVFMYGYFFSPYLAGNINNNNDGAGNSVVAVG
jgi:hypothetical protein